MRIQHNILAMNAYRNYNNNTSALGKNLEKLSSGYKINRAGDDAAGLAISEKMRAQITGLNAAQKNVKDGVSLVKTAEGAMQEIQDMLNRMDYLATQSANGTYDNEVDRANLQKEVDALKTEINRIADSANFNGIKLLDGSLDATVNETTTEYTSGMNNLPIAQNVIKQDEETTKVGQGTVLHVDGSDKAEKTSFNVELHNINLTGEHGDTVSVKIGNQAVTLTFDKNASSSTPVAGKLAVGTVDANQLAAAIQATFAAGTQEISGQQFTATTTASGGLKFEQTNDPINSTELVDPCEDVQITFTKSGTEGKFTYTLDATAKESLANSDKIEIDGKEYDFALASSSATASKVLDNYKVDYDGNGKLTITNLAGTSAPASVKIATSAGGVATTSTGTAGNVAAAASLTSTGAIGGATAGCDSLKITFYQGDPADNIVAGTMSVSVGGGNAKVTIGGVEYSVTVGAGGVGYTITAVEKGASGNQEFTFKVEATSLGAVSTTAVKTVSTSTGADEKGAVIDYNLSGVSVGNTMEFNGIKFTVATTGSDTVREMANFINSNDELKKMYKATANGTTLQIEFKFTPTVADATAGVSVKKGGVAEKDLGAGKAVTSSSSAEGTWNVKTTQNKTGAVSGAGVLASTTFKLNSGIVKDKNTLTIGNKTYTFKVGKDSTTTGENLIDLSKYEEGDTENLIKQAALLLSQDASHEVFTIGYDAAKPGEISIHEKAGQKVYTNGELGDLKTFDELVYFNSFKDETVTEVTTAKGTALKLQIGDTSDDFNQMKVSIGDMHVDAMKYKDEETGEESDIAGIDISTQEGAAAAVNVIKNAINYVSSVRGDLGATQNRLEHTQNNLSVMAENIQDAESTIRDTDVADEMMSYVKNNILVQSAQAMLAQANQVPQGVLQLLG